MSTETFEGLTPTEMRSKLLQKEHAASDLSNWLSRHEPNESEYRHVWDDRNELNKEIHTLKRLLEKQHTAKPLERSLNESFEL